MLWKVLTSSLLCLLIFGKNVQTGNDHTDTPYLGSQQAESQSNFYPSFPPFQNQPLGHSRPFYFNQPEAAYSQRSQSPYNQPVAYDSPRYSSYKDDSYTSSSDSQGLLGSGNFGVIRGGTFYGENDGQGASGGYTDDYNSYFHNGHGRPDFYYGNSNNNPKPYQHEQFANFRDFADINVPTDRQYSHYVVVYVNKNGTKQEKEVVESVKKPKNIIESLAMLDEAEEVGTTASTTVDEMPEKKLSKSKRKLAKLLPEKKYKVKKTVKKIARDLNEPLLAQS